MPENIRTYAIFSPAGPRSILKTLPETGPSPSRDAAGSNSAMPVISSLTPAPFRAEPKNTGTAPPSSIATARSPSDSIGIASGVNLSSICSSTRAGSAPARSVLFTKRIVGTSTRCSARNSSGVCGCTPSTAETTSTAPSRTLSARSTSAMKSGWPGVSIRLTVTSSIANDTTADLIVMPRCCSSASESVWVLPSSTLPISSMTPAA